MFVHYTSHRAYEDILRGIGRMPQEFYVFSGRHYLELTEEEFTQLRNKSGRKIAGLSRARVNPSALNCCRQA